MAAQDPKVFCATSYDYVIVGGGTAGLALASRLTEDPAVTVAVLEAGIDRTDDFKVKTPAMAPSMLMDPTYGWGYKTEPQENANGRVIDWPRGRQLGGSSSM